LEALGAQLVPPEFHQASNDSSLFGSQLSDQEDQAEHERLHDQQYSKVPLPPSPSATVRNHSSVFTRGTAANNRQLDRKRWKNLRDFVDDQAIEDILETIESNRTALDVGDLSNLLVPNIDVTVV
jgi:autophagy-related protein 17